MTRFASTALAVAFAFGGYGISLAADSTPAPSSGGGHGGGFREACGADLKQYCPTASTREERHACVDANKDKFSASCKTFMASHPRRSDGSKPDAGGQ